VIDGVSLTHDEATKAVKQMLKNSARRRTEQLEKGAEELRALEPMERGEGEDRFRPG
jgi:hypothetical protein